MSISTKKKSEDLLDKCKRAYQALDIPAAYEAALGSIEADPSNYRVYYLMKSLVPVIFVAYPDKFKKNRIFKLLDKSIELSPGVPVIYHFQGIMHKLEKNYSLAEESFFKTVFFNRFFGDIENHHHYLFEMAFVYKNRMFLDIFTRLALSIDWNVALYKTARQVALPREIIEGRIFRIDFSSAPIINIRRMETNTEKLYLISLQDELPPASVLLNYLNSFEKQGICFFLYHLLPESFLKKNRFELARVRKYFPQNPVMCSAAAQIHSYRLTICPVLKSQILPVLKKIQFPWDFKVEKYPFCQCY